MKLIEITNYRIFNGKIEKFHKKWINPGYIVAIQCEDGEEGYFSVNMIGDNYCTINKKDFKKLIKR